VALLLLCLQAGAAEEVPKVQLADGGTAAMPVMIGKGATPTVRGAAEELALLLKRISGAAFTVSEGSGRKGIAVGRAKDFPELDLGGALDLKGIAGREQYLLRSHRDGLYLIGQTEIAVENAVWDLLHRLGLRQYFPGEAWEIVPEKQSLAIRVNAVEAPDYLSRSIWCAHGMWPDHGEGYRTWLKRNRIRKGFDLQTAHAYGQIIRANKAAFDAHPEYYPLRGGRRDPSPQAKLCIGNPTLRQLVADWAVAHFTENPEADSISVDPSDGGGWCECEACKAIGSASDRALLLANTVARQVRRKIDSNRYVGMYAYNEHSPAPTKVRVEPGVIVSVATAFIKGGKSAEEIAAGWQGAGSELLGIRDYFSVYLWDGDMPGQSRINDPVRLAATLARYHQLGTRFISAESSENFGPNGLSYYVAGRVLWDVKEADRVEAIRQEFLDTAFGSAANAMKAYYDLFMQKGAPALFCDNLLAGMYRTLKKAMESTGDEAVRRRIGQLVIYTRFLDLKSRYQAATGPERQKRFEQLLKHIYRNRGTRMHHSFAFIKVIQDKTKGDSSVTVPTAEMEEARDAVKNAPKQPTATPLDDAAEGDDEIDLDEESEPETRDKEPRWKQGLPSTPNEIARMLAEGIERYEFIEIDTRHFSNDLVPAGPLGLRKVEPLLGAKRKSRGRRWYYLWAPKAPFTFEMKMINGLFKHYRDRGDADIRLFWAVHEGDGEYHRDGLALTQVGQANVPPDGKPYPFTFTTQHKGLHLLKVKDGYDCSKLFYQEGLRFTQKLVMERKQMDMGSNGKQRLYFYVPKGTEHIGGYAAARGTIEDPAGNTAHTFGKAGYFKVPVPRGMDGKLWVFKGSMSKLGFMNIPSFVARNGEELLLPREVVEADAK
jgi:hypothetical protein